jgi:hypothetical protein
LRSEQLHPFPRGTRPSAPAGADRGNDDVYSVSGEGEDDHQSRGDRFTNTIQLSFYLKRPIPKCTYIIKGRLSSMVNHGPVTARLRSHRPFETCSTSDVPFSSQSPRLPASEHPRPAHPLRRPLSPKGM